MYCSAPEICSERATQPISISEVWSNPFGAAPVFSGNVLSKIRLSAGSPARFSSSSRRQSLAATSAMVTPFGPCASTAKCCASRANGTLRAVPLRVPSAFRVILSFGCTGATDIAPSGETIPPWDNSQPASIVSASGTGTAKRPAALSSSKPSARLAPAPPCSSDTQASVRPFSVSAFQRRPSTCRLWRC